MCTTSGVDAVGQRVQAPVEVERRRPRRRRCRSWPPRSRCARPRPGRWPATRRRRPTCRASSRPAVVVGPAAREPHRPAEPGQRDGDVGRAAPGVLTSSRPSRGTMSTRDSPTTSTSRSMRRLYRIRGRGGPRVGSSHGRAPRWTRPRTRRPTSSCGRRSPPAPPPASCRRAPACRPSGRWPPRWGSPPTRSPRPTAPSRRTACSVAEGRRGTFVALRSPPAPTAADAAAAYAATARRLGLALPEAHTLLDRPGESAQMCAATTPSRRRCATPDRRRCALPERPVGADVRCRTPNRRRCAPEATAPGARRPGRPQPRGLTARFTKTAAGFAQLGTGTPTSSGTCGPTHRVPRGGGPKCVRR